MIQAQILHRLRMNRQPNISAPLLSEDEQRKLEMIFERMHSNGHMEMAAQGIDVPLLSKLQSFYPSCKRADLFFLTLTLPERHSLLTEEFASKVLLK